MTSSARRRMDAEVFALALNRLRVYSNGRRNASFEGAAMVMIDGCPIAVAVRLTGVRRQAVYKAMKRIEGALKSIGICPYCGRRDA